MVIINRDVLGQFSLIFLHDVVSLITLSSQPIILIIGHFLTSTKFSEILPLNKFKLIKTWFKTKLQKVLKSVNYTDF